MKWLNLTAVCIVLCWVVKKAKHLTDFVFLSMKDTRQALNASRGFAKNGAELREATTAI